MKIKLKRGSLVNILGEENREEKEHGYEQPRLYKWLLARVVGLSEVGVVSAEYDTHSEKINIIYGADNPWNPNKTISKKAPKDFVDFYKPYVKASYEDRTGAIKRYREIKLVKEDIKEKKETQKHITEEAHRIAQEIDTAEEKLKWIEQQEKEARRKI